MTFTMLATLVAIGISTFSSIIAIIAFFVLGKDSNVFLWAALLVCVMHVAAFISGMITYLTILFRDSWK